MAVRTAIRPALLKHLRYPLQFLDGFSALEFHQFTAIAGFHPADAEIGDQKAHHVAVAKVGDE